MKSKTIVFPRPKQVNLLEEEILKPGNDELTVQTLVTLWSIGTELTCYHGDSEHESARACFGYYYTSLLFSARLTIKGISLG